LLRQVANAMTLVSRTIHFSHSRTNMQPGPPSRYGRQFWNQVVD
jgi:hypothetical protein